MGMVTFMYMAMDNNHTIYHMFMGKQGDTSEVNCKQQQKEIAEEPKMSCFPQWGVPNRWLEFQADGIQ